MATFAAERGAAVPPAVAAAWSAATEDWSEQARHDAVFHAAAHHGGLVWVAAQYRAALRSPPRSRQPSDAPFRSPPGEAAVAIAERQLARVQRAAEATLLATAVTRPDRIAAPYRATRAILGLLVVAIIAGMLIAGVLRRGRPASATETRPVPSPLGGATAAPEPAAPAAPGVRRLRIAPRAPEAPAVPTGDADPAAGAGRR
jgi:hypothetical protein